MLADAGGEDHRVDRPEHGEVGADVLADAIAVDVERQLGGLVALRAERLDLAEVVVPGEPLQARLVVEARGPTSLAAGCTRRGGSPRTAILCSSARAVP